MGLKSRINSLEKNMKQKGKDPKAEWREHIARLEEMDILFLHVLAGELQACIRYCELSSQGKKWRNNGEGMMDSLYKYRKIFINHEAEKKGVKPEYDKENSLDIFYENLKATFLYLKARANDPQVQGK
jgi:hypothetical protein